MADVIAHRGASRRAPENTVAAFQLAVELGSDGVELDARRTRDGVLVVHHDAFLSDGRPIVETSLRDLPSHVPTLGAALDACRGATVNIEIKNSDVEPDFDPADQVAIEVLAELAERGPDSGPWLISSFRLATVDRCRALAPDVPTAWLVMQLDEAVVTTSAERGHVAVHPWEASVTAPMVERCHDAGLAVNVWTCDDPARAIELDSWGVDGIVTDVPDLILEAFGRS